MNVRILSELVWVGGRISRFANKNNINELDVKRILVCGTGSGTGRMNANQHLHVDVV